MLHILDVIKLLAYQLTSRDATRSGADPSCVRLILQLKYKRDSDGVSASGANNFTHQN